MERVQKLRDYLERYYREHGQNLLFHGWHHIVFVTDKAVSLAKEMGIANPEMIAAAGLTHDLGYLVSSDSHPAIGNALREKILAENEFKADEIEVIADIIYQADARTRTRLMPIESEILSDADTLFKALPVMMPVFTARSLKESNLSLRELATKVLSFQAGLLEKNMYFYTEIYKERYLDWGKQDVQQWRSILKALDDRDVATLLESVGVKV